MIHFGIALLKLLVQDFPLQKVVPPSKYFIICLYVIFTILQIYVGCKFSAGMYEELRICTFMDTRH